ncbi:MAG: DUF4338 domain-containing protein [Deltaproteobacteria bacterium]|nr:DUF4338 domain-containing protein [Deltaproteobacteria bacterium]
MLPITVRKRTICDVDLPFIQAVLDEHWSCGRTQISKILCQKWNWFQPNGRLKDMACREVLVTLERQGHLQLPPGRHNGRNEKRNRFVASVLVDQSPMEGSLAGYGPVTMTLVRNTPMEPLYNSLVHQYHYLGFRQIVGQHLKYMAFIGDRPVACLGWGSAAWSVKSRETFIGWDKPTKEKNLSFVVNNTRFLILPWVSIKCLASKLLAMNARRIALDWMAVYRQPVYLLETFVEKDRFRGTCYKAANWICVGQTKGTAKRGHDHLVHGLIKDVFLYPLRKDFRVKLIAGR